MVRNILPATVSSVAVASMRTTTTTLRCVTSVILKPERLSQRVRCVANTDACTRTMDISLIEMTNITYDLQVRMSGQWCNIKNDVTQEEVAQSAIWYYINGVPLEDIRVIKVTREIVTQEFWNGS